MNDHITAMNLEIVERNNLLNRNGDVHMALHHEGFSQVDWDSWSQKDAVSYEEID